MSGRRRKPALANYTDRHGRAHRIVLRGRLLLDLCRFQAARVVAELRDDEGEEQVEALLRGSEIDPGYLARMASEREPICRSLRPDDLTPARASEADRGEQRGEADGRERRAA